MSRLMPIDLEFLFLESILFFYKNCVQINVEHENSLIFKIMTQEEKDKELLEVFNIEIVREFLREEDPNISDENVRKIWAKCSGNPWNALSIYKIIQFTKQNPNT